jgi:TIR domain
MAKPLGVFVSYAHADVKYVYTLKKYLCLLIRRGFLRLWTDREIKASESWDRVIDEQIRSCQIILFLISADFMDSNYIMKTEMKAAVQRYKEGNARIIQIYLTAIVSFGAIVRDPVPRLVAAGPCTGRRSGGSLTSP